MASPEEEAAFQQMAAEARAAASGTFGVQAATQAAVQRTQAARQPGAVALTKARAIRQIVERSSDYPVGGDSLDVMLWREEALTIANAMAVQSETCLDVEEVVRAAEKAAEERATAAAARSAAEAEAAAERKRLAAEAAATARQQLEEKAEVRRRELLRRQEEEEAARRRDEALGVQWIDVAIALGLDNDDQARGIYNENIDLAKAAVARLAEEQERRRELARARVGYVVFASGFGLATGFFVGRTTGSVGLGVGAAASAFLVSWVLAPRFLSVADAPEFKQGLALAGGIRRLGVS